MTAGAASPPNPWVAILTSQTVGEYKLERDLGAGNFGIVFEAVHETTGGRFALKVLTPTSDPGAVMDFKNEGTLLKQLSPCAGVVNFVDDGTHNLEVHGPGGIPVPIEMPYLVMTQASGSLDQLVLDPVLRTRLGEVERLKLWRTMIKALMQMHLHGVAHRDLKCSNCLLHVTKSETKIRFGDLGRARDLGIPASHSAEEYLVGRGDLRFAPPESLFWQGGMSKEDFLAADYYGLGSLLVELITGQSMTGLAIGDFRSVFEVGRDDYLHGRRRDLTTLNLRYRSVIAEVVDQLPKSIQSDARAVLSSLCSPEPADRLTASPYSRDRNSHDRLTWILRRTDIMIRRLEIEIREERRRERATA
jgi:serine/threonine protein kinase